jgi:ferredoxin-NADP reductase
MSPVDPPARELDAKVLGVYEEADGVKTFRLEVPPDFAFTPGMWVMIQFPDAREHASAYSLSSSPFEKGYVEISLSKVGPLTQRLFELRGGETLKVRGPYGKWLYRDDARHAVLISDGTGMTPFRAMARYVLDKRLPNTLTILYSARTPAQFLYAKDLARFAEAGIKVYRTITHPEATTRWDGPVGPIDISVIEREVAGYRDAHYFLCGPKTLVEQLTEQLLSRSIARDRIHYEKWGDYEWA